MWLMMPGVDMNFRDASTSTGTTCPALSQTHEPFDSVTEENCHTIHELREVDAEIALLCIAISKNAIVRQRPPKGIRNDHNNTLWSTAWRVCDVAVESMKFLDASSWRARVKGASSATRFERHLRFGVMR